MLLKRKLLFVVTEDWYFVSHRLPLAVAAKKAGYDVVVATRMGQYADTIRSAGIRLVPFDLSRRAGNPLKEFLSLINLYRQERPYMVHHVAMKPVFYGALAARLTGVPTQVNAVAGLGWLFISGSRVVRWGRPLIGWVLARLLSSPSCRVIVQNPDDMRQLEQVGVPEARLRLVRGVGVDTTKFSPVSEPQKPICIVMAARIIWIKGVGEFVEAARQLKKSGVNARFILVGYPDAGNPASVPQSIMETWQKKNVVECWGHREDMPNVMAASHVVCLPSHGGEGVPKVLLEAASCGRPIVTTDVSGCREVVREGENGLLVPARNVEALVKALLYLIENPKLRAQMGKRGREIAIKEFSSERAIEQTLVHYGGLIR